METMVMGTLVGILTVLGLTQVGAWIFKGLWGRRPLRGCFLVVPLERGGLELQLRRVRSAILWGEDLRDTLVILVGEELGEEDRALCRIFCREMDGRLAAPGRLAELLAAGEEAPGKE